MKFPCLPTKSLPEPSRRAVRKATGTGSSTLGQDEMILSSRRGRSTLPGRFGFPQVAVKDRAFLVTETRHESSARGRGKVRCDNVHRAAQA